MGEWFEVGVSRGSPPRVEVGDTIEIRVYDDAGNPQGTVLVGVLEEVGLHRKGPVVAGMFLGASDVYYHWWMNEGPNAPAKDRGFYHLCAEQTAACPGVRKYPDMIHTDRYRNLGTAMAKSKKVTWLKDKILMSAYEFCYKKFKGVVGGVGDAPEAAKKPRADAGLTWPDEDDPAKKVGEQSSEESDDEKSESDDPGVKAKIMQLRKELKKAEQDAAEGRQRKKDAMNKRRGKGEGVTRAKSAVKDKKKKKKSREDKEKSKNKKKDKQREGRKEKRRRSPSAGASDEGSDEKNKKKKKRAESDPDESGDSSSRSDEELFGAKKGSESKRKTGDEDRGPFGGGEPVKFAEAEDETSGSESDFHKGPTASVKSSQQRLLAYTNRCPGRLACRLLLKMQAATARDTVGPASSKSSRTPPVAMHHILTVLLPNLGAKAGLRSARELRTLGSIMDQLAVGSPSKAADIVCQRIKAVERASHEGHWGSAQFLKLLPPENSMLLGRNEEMFVTKEYLLDQKLKSYDRPPGRGEGGGKGKAKGAKGKTKEKGDRGLGTNQTRRPRSPRPSEGGGNWRFTPGAGESEA